MKNILTFERIIGISAIFIASCAAYFSILGIGMLFSGSHIAAMIMALSLELGKLVATSFLYRYWKKTQTFLKTYLITAVLILMVITSLGIFGYLSSAYQSSSVENKLTEDKITMIENQKKYSENAIEDAKKRISTISNLRNSQEDRLNQSLTNKYIVRNQIALDNISAETEQLIAQSQKNLESENNKIEKSMNDLQNYDKQISELKFQNSGKKDILTFKFVAEALHMELNTVVKWFIIVLISVFDPLAICLLLAYNTSIYKNEENKKIKDKENELPIVPVVSNVSPEPVIPTILPQTSVPSIPPEPIIPPETPVPPQLPHHPMRGLFSF